MLIRSATEKDLSAILKIINHEILYTTSLYHYDPRTEEQQLQWFREKQENNFPIIVAEIENEVIGFGSYGTFRPWAAYRFSVEHSIYVHKDFQGQGVGKVLMVHLIELAKKEGYRTMLAGVDASNTASVAFHKKFGFKEVGIFKQVGYKFDKWLDLTFLQLLFQEESSG
ncbi:GNAT family N-acetyltransferase [Cytophaga sp. FL35]|uniref:GNAT family N-acetyltransferase n=1 Tax=Cytophaga sp. FL35 TaxID=1904456 RepID=UPI00165363D0|nr:GNAT family N-acetyltransferase [Cytophaga sp. FL35]MBC6999463.1 N-acetyltransferase [Cytophaga sp. FL35]